jgi:hypothetical protein
VPHVLVVLGPELDVALRAGRRRRTKAMAEAEAASVSLVYRQTSLGGKSRRTEPSFAISFLSSFILMGSRQVSGRSRRRIAPQPNRPSRLPPPDP